MALSGSVTVEATPNARDLLVFSWVATQDASARTSTVSWKMEMVADAYGTITGVPVERVWEVVIDGQTFTGTADVNMTANETRTMASGQIVLTHSADGTRSFQFIFSQDLSITWGASSGDPQEIGTVTGSGIGELDAFEMQETKPEEAEEFQILDYINGYLLALCSSARVFPKSEPVAYLYGADQIRLPGLPELPYKYAAIEYTEMDLILSGGKLARMARLVCSSEPIYMTVMITGSGYSILGDAVYYGFANDEFLWGLSFNLDKPYPPINEWAKIGEAHFDERTDVSYVVGAMLTEWSNHDLYYRASDGTLGNVWCSASEPVPVYE